mmetsp:Transcript_27862/g.26704  ORF Transcript_27862/g.26704 Transcript_27862/m.26704 type:complete len:342 (+) Transcript_27862:175-1200(+)
MKTFISSGQIPKSLIKHLIPLKNDLKFRCHNYSSIYSISAREKAEQMKSTFDEQVSKLKVEKLSSNFGVFKESESEDVTVLINNFTSPALARALRERETTLHNAAHLLNSNNLKELEIILRPHLKSSIDKRRTESHAWDISNGLTRRELVLIERQLHRMPREVFQASSKRASVVIPLCNVAGVASILFERRSATVRTHKQEVCFPGGMVEEGIDATIIQTSLREMEEELGIPPEKAEVLGVLRCNWDEVENMTGISVTPVVGYIGEFNELKLTPNPDEVEQLFTVPLSDLLDKNKWTIRDFSTPVFTGGPFVIWGLTAYLLHRFLQDVVNKCSGQENDFYI